MALPPMKGKQKLIQSLSDMGFKTPYFEKTVSPFGVVTSQVTIYLPNSQGQEQARTFVAAPADVIEIAEDSAARMALNSLRSHFAHNVRVSTYLKQRVFPTTKKAWEKACTEWNIQHDQVVARNRQLALEKYQQTWIFHNHMQQYQQIVFQQQAAMEAKLEIAQDEIHRLRRTNSLIQKQIQTLKKNSHSKVADLPETIEPDFSNLSVLETTLAYPTTEETLGKSLLEALN